MKRLLANPQIRISEIAYEVGFNSLTHFNRMFRKMTGESPTAYREKLVENGVRGTPETATLRPRAAADSLFRWWRSKSAPNPSGKRCR